MAEDAYLQIEGLEGELTAPHHEKWIEISDFGFSISSEEEELSSPSKAGRPSAMSINKAIDITSTKLAIAACWRKPFKKMTLELCTAAGGKAPVTFMRYVLMDTFIKSYNVGGGGDGPPAESLEIVYDSINMTYFQLDHATAESKGVSSEAQWSISKNSDKVE